MEQDNMTAVEWLVEQISEKQPNGFYVIDTLEDVKRIFKQAKQMEEEQKYETSAFWFGRGVLAGKENRIEELKPIKE